MSTTMSGRRALPSARRRGAVPAAATLNTHTRYLHESILDYAEALLATFPAALVQAMFTCTGIEANDLAVRIASITAATASSSPRRPITASPSGRRPVALARASVAAPAPTVPCTVAAPVAGDGAAVRARRGRRARRRWRGRSLRPAALILDTIFSSDGIFPDPGPGFLAPALGAFAAAGGIFIADEVQPGFGRTGRGDVGVRPPRPRARSRDPRQADGRRPSGRRAMVPGPSSFQGFGSVARYFNTFGGNPVAAPRRPTPCST